MLRLETYERGFEPLRPWGERGPSAGAAARTHQHILALRGKPRLGLALVASFLPLVVKKDGCDDHGAYDQEADLQFAHGQAAAGSSRSFNASSMSTATTRDTPRSCIVTPISWCAISMVILLWLMNRNWVSPDIFLTRSQKRSVLASSSGASTSSSRQNGAGFSWKKENTKAIAVSAFSPPESRWMVVFFLPGGRAITCTPQSSISSPVMMSWASPPPKSAGNISPKPRFTVSNVLCSNALVSRSMRRIAF